METLKQIENKRKKMTKKQIYYNWYLILTEEDREYFNNEITNYGKMMTKNFDWHITEKELDKYTEYYFGY